ncbi:MAG: S41 family peptidase [Pseudomonadota bacterium]
MKRRIDGAEPTTSRNQRASALGRVRFALALLPALLAACGGGGGGNDPPLGDGAQVCAPTNPYRADAVAPTRTGSLSDEKAWVASYMDAAYLWYSEIPSVNANDPAYSNTGDVYTSLDSYFNALLTRSVTGSGAAKDRFSFTYPTKAWNDLAGSGVVSGYGIEWYWDSPTPPRGIRVAYTEPGSPAALAGVQRGDRLVTADGVSSEAGDSNGVATLNAAMFPGANGQSHSFSFDRHGFTLNANLVSANVTKKPVYFQVIHDCCSKTGHIVFNDHIATAEQGLIEAITAFKATGIDGLVVDLRYNGGGYLYIASELAYMIAGPTRTAGKTFERLVYNDKRSGENEIMPFRSESCFLDSNFSCTNVQPLPTLNLSRVTVITTGSSCSASEAFINGLRGIDVEVTVVGDTTCGKPYGFTAKDNCGISYFPIEFKGENAKGFSDYPDGFAATCPAVDDFSMALDHPSEGMLSAALYSARHDGACDPVAAQAARRSQLAAGPQAQPRLLRGPERENRILLRR